MKKALLLCFVNFFTVSIVLTALAQDAIVHKPILYSKKTIDSIKPVVNMAQKFLDSASIKNAPKHSALNKLSGDTIKKQLNKQTVQYKTAVESKLKLPSDSLMKEKVSTYVKSKANLSGIKLKGSKEEGQSPFNLSAENGLMYLTESPLKSGPGFLNNFSVAGKLTIAKIPITLDLSNNYNSDSGFEPFQSNLFKFNFDKENMLNSFKSDVEHATDFKASFLKGMELPDFTGKAILAKLKSMPDAKFLNNNPAFISYLKDPEKINSLLSLSEKQLREKVSELIAMQKSGIEKAGNEKINASNDKVQNSIKNVSDSINHIKTSVENKKEILKDISQKGKNLNSTIADSITSVISSIRSKLAENGLDAQKVNLVQKIISGKGNITDFETELFNELSKNPKASGLQSAFSKVRAFQTGAFADKLPGSFLNRDLFVKGVNFSVKTQKGPVSVGFGKQNDLGTSKDAGFQNSVYSSPRFFSYLSVPTNQSSFGSGKLSWVGTFSKQESMPAFQSTSLGRNSIIFTVSQTLATKKVGKFTVDVSKSANQYKNTLSPGSEQLILDKSILSNYFSDDLFETMSMGLNHDFEDERRNLNSNVYFNYAGVGYQNPGSAGGSNMKMRLGGSLKKKFYNNKLALNLRTDLKNTPLSFSSDSHWQNFQIQFDSRYKLNKKVNINLKYMENDMNKTGAVNTQVYSSRKFQVGGNANYKIAGKYSFSNLTIAQQDVANHQFAASGGSFITANYLQSLVLKNTTVSASLFYNKETSAVKLIGDMLNADLSCQYSLFNLNITSSVTYLDNQNIARQVGIKQNLQLFAGKHFDINAYADVRKNLIQSLYPDLYAAGRGELSIKYYLKNKF